MLGVYLALPAKYTVSYPPLDGQTTFTDLLFRLGGVRKEVVTAGFVGLLLLFFFAYKFPLFPLGGADTLASLVLPALALGIGGAAYYTRVIRQQLGDELKKDYIRAARAKGLPERMVIGKHALRNGLMPVITLVANLLPAVLGGSVVIEYIFGIPGIGLWTLEAIYTRDYNVIMGVQLLTTLLVLFGLLLADIGYALVDPRIRYH